MTSGGLHAVTGAFGYSGRFIARRLLEEGRSVMTLTNSTPAEDPFHGCLRIEPFNFDHPDKLARALEGVEVLYNTYWVRFNHRRFTHAQAISNSRTLFEAAARAGVRRIVHISITNPALDSPIEYFRGKAQVEQALVQSGVPHSILRPAILFGGEDILVNNIAWALRRLPVFGIFGFGGYKVQPIHVEDLAGLAVASGRYEGNPVVNAIGPETFTYRELVQTIGQIIGKPRPILPTPPLVAYLISRLIGFWVKDVMLTRDEVRGLMGNCLFVEAPPAGSTLLTRWASDNADFLGMSYASELARRRLAPAPSR